MIQDYNKLYLLWLNHYQKQSNYAPTDFILKAAVHSTAATPFRTGE